MTKPITIAVPAWGERCVGLFLDHVLPTHLAAIECLHQEYRGSIEVRYVVQTDRPELMAYALRSQSRLTFLPPPKANMSDMYGMTVCHGFAVREAEAGDRVVLTNADMPWSVEALVAVERQFRQGKKAIVTSGTRTLEKTFWRPGKIRTARELQAWSLKHIHPVNRNCFYGIGSCHLPWGVYFQEGGNVILRGFHLHPFAIVAGAGRDFTGTIDLDLIENYEHEDVHLVTDADEMAVAEISPADKVDQLGSAPWPLDVDSILGWAVRAARPMHWWNFRHRICIAGDPDAVTFDHAIAEKILSLCPFEKSMVAPL